MVQVLLASGFRPRHESEALLADLEQPRLPELPFVPLHQVIQIRRCLYDTVAGWRCCQMAWHQPLENSNLQNVTTAEVRTRDDGQFRVADLRNTSYQGGHARR